MSEIDLGKVIGRDAVLETYPLENCSFTIFSNKVYIGTLTIRPTIQEGKTFETDFILPFNATGVYYYNGVMTQIDDIQEPNYFKPMWDYKVELIEPNKVRVKGLNTQGNYGARCVVTFMLYGGAK